MTGGKMKLRVLVLALLLILLCACGGETGNAKLTVGTSQLYAEEDVLDAMEIVLDFFEQEFDHCELLTLSYDEAVSQKFADGWARQYSADQAIVLESSFYVGQSEGSLEPNETYEGWDWILTRSTGGKWTLQTWGYG